MIKKKKNKFPSFHTRKAKEKAREARRKKPAITLANMMKRKESNG